MVIDILKEHIASEFSGCDVYFTPGSVPGSIEIPVEWMGFGFFNNKSSCLPFGWSGFSEELPWVYAWLEKCILGTALLVSDKVGLLYVYSEGGELLFYIGGAPVSDQEMMLPKYKYMPKRLKEFYSTVHDGFGFYIGCTMGPSRLKDFVVIKDLCDEDISTLPDLIGVFSSGAGDYLSLDANSSGGKGFIWWHENPNEPELDIDLWAVMDVWMSIFLENSEANEIL